MGDDVIPSNLFLSNPESLGHVAQLRISEHSRRWTLLTPYMVPLDRRHPPASSLS
ncbi:MAG: hypothetical protein ACTIC1_03465 [Brevibacterium sp.]